MIQRIQSVFLVLMIGALISSVFFDFWVKSDPSIEEAVNMNAYELVKLKLVDGKQVIEETSGHIYIFILPLLAAGVALFSLFQYKNRLRQMQLGAFNSLLMAGALAAVVYRSTVMNDMLATVTRDSPLFGFYAIAAAMILNISSNRFIKKDDKLVKSMDRIR